jgi:chromosome segregation ATPase
MTSYHRALAVLIVAVLGIWGCTQGPSSAEKARTLETKVSRLEDDLRAASAACDQFKKKLAEAENLAVQQRQELDDLKALLKTRTAERDTLSQQFEGFRKNLKDLIGQTEAALAKPASPPANTVSQSKVPNL